jgi:hypothetical protein
MDVEEDEQVGGSVAFMLTIIALELARPGRDRLADLANQLDRALVEANHWTPLRVEIKVSGRSQPGGGARFPEDVGMLGEPDQFTRKKLQGPTGGSFRRLRTSRRNQQGFLFAGRFTARSGTRLFVECRLHGYRFADDPDAVLKLLKKYPQMPISFADSCLVVDHGYPFRAPPST